MSSYSRNVTHCNVKNTQGHNRYHRPSLSSLSKKSGDSNKENTKVSSQAGGKFFSFKDPSQKKSSNSADMCHRELCQLEMMISKTDNSMDEILSSSIKQLENIMKPTQSCQSLEEENAKLRNMLQKMQILLKEKLQLALQRQREQLSKMVSDYISLITKLLQDKQNLTVKVQILQQQTDRRTQQISGQYEQKLKKIIQYKNQQIIQSNKQIEVLKQQLLDRSSEHNLTEIHHKQASSRRQSNQCLSCRSLYLQPSQTAKYELSQIIKILEQYEKQNTQLKLEVSRLKLGEEVDGDKTQYFSKLKEIEQAFRQQLVQVQKMHEQEFQEYEKVIKQTIAKKNECIQRLNFIIEDLRSRKKSS